MQQVAHGGLPGRAQRAAERALADEGQHHGVGAVLQLQQHELHRNQNNRRSEPLHTEVKQWAGACWVDELRLARHRDAVGVLEQRDQQAPHDDRVGDVVDRPPLPDGALVEGDDVPRRVVEAEQLRVAEVARLAGAPHLVMAKTRRGDRDVSVVMDAPRDAAGRTPVLVDDIISTGHTLMAAAGALREAGLGAPVCVGVHALFDEAAHQRMLASGIARVVSCDSIAHPTNAIGLAAGLAPAVRALAGDAVSS